MIHPLRASLFFILFGLFDALIMVYIFLFIQIPFALSPRYRERHRVRLWNRIIRVWGRLFFHAARIITGFRIAVEGMLPESRHIIVANHQSMMDIPVLFEILSSLHLKFVAKKVLGTGWMNIPRALRNGGFVLVDARNPRESLRGLRRFAAGLEAWQASPLIFPEGIRTFDGTVGRFHRPGLAILVRDTGLPVQPVVIDGLWRARGLGAVFFHLPGARVRVRLLEPIPAEEAARSLDDLPGRLEDLIRGELDAMRAGR